MKNNTFSKTEPTLYKNLVSLKQWFVLSVFQIQKVNCMSVESFDLPD